MGKKKQLSEKLREFYRGVPAKSPNDVDKTDMQTISEALKVCVPNKGCLFKVDFNGESKHVRLCVGLREGLRYLKRQQTWAMIYDDTAGQYLQNYLNGFASKYRIPTVRAKGLIDIAPRLKLNTMLLISIVMFQDSTRSHKVIESQELTKLCKLLSDVQTETTQNTTFRLPVIEKVPAKSKKTKEIKEFRT